jgi:hypothetical protein
MKTSCGALFYSYDNEGNLGIILGLEGVDWLPFKGCNEIGETFEQTAIREIKEETCGLIVIENINLEHRFTSKRKHYCIGLCEVPYDIIDKFADLRANECRHEYNEKRKLRFFKVQETLHSDMIHNISKASIKYYWNKLMALKKKVGKVEENIERTRKHSLGLKYIKQLARNLKYDRSTQSKKTLLFKKNRNLQQPWRSGLI